MMRQKFHDLAEKGRILEGDWGTQRGERFGLFMMTCPATGGFLKIIASAGDESDDEQFPNGTRWDHVSVSLKDRTPTWAEMAWVKSLFFEPEECAVEYHPPQSVYVNRTPNVLHIWRPLDVTIPMPPVECV